VELVGIADADAQRAQRRADALGIPNAFGSLDEMMRFAKPDAVHVLTPPTTHAGLAVAAMRAGAHVYVEKPMAASLADCDTMIACAEREARLLCVGHCMAFDPLMRRALELIGSGKLGELRHVAAVYTFDTKRIPNYDGKGWYRQLAGGFLEDLASHPASLLLPLIGAPTRVQGSERGEELTALVDGERATATMLVSLGTRPEEVTLEVRGTAGTLRIDFSAMTMTVQPSRRIPKKLAHGVKNLETATQLLAQTLTSTAKVATRRADTTKGIHSLIEAFYAAIRDGGPAPVSGGDGREVVRLLRELWPEPAPAHPPRWVLSPVTSSSGGTGRRQNGEPRTALVTGATGFIGRHLVRALTERGLVVRALARNPERAKEIDAPAVEVVVGDVGDAAVTSGLAEGMDVVFHLASVMQGSPEEFERVDLAGGRRLIEEAKRAGVRRFVFTSTMGAYKLGGLRDGALVTEEMTDDPDAVGPYARAKLLIERELLHATAAGELESVIVRPGLVFGPGAPPTLEHLPHMGALRGERYIMFGDGEVPLQLTYVENTVDALWRSAVSPDATGGIFTIIDDDLPTQREYVARLATLTGRRYRIAAIPRPAAWSIGLGVETVARVLRRKPPTTRHLLLGKTVKLGFDTSRARQVLGWTPAVSWEEGLERALEWERSRRRERTRQAAPPVSADRQADTGSSPAVRAEEHAEHWA
jgi:nucleoside-diphosphate-sugar epimerase